MFLQQNVVVVVKECFTLHEPVGAVPSRFTAGFQLTEFKSPFSWHFEQRKVVLCSRVHAITLLENLQIFAFAPVLLM